MILMSFVGEIDLTPAPQFVRLRNEANTTNHRPPRVIKRINGYNVGNVLCIMLGEEGSFDCQHFNIYK